ncbi:ribosomal L1 domain-containing protein CG13096 [Xylocopa sonorina]|uniref:ribosomal L1 domain-containing protein CG13096 n=1 Tax=Xylocopa sonorina TaxID=1818115 RepID=UPI00403B16D0
MKMVTHKMIKKHKQSVKVVNDTKKQNVKLKSKLKSDKLNNKKLSQGRNTNIKSVQVSAENMKSGNKQLRKNVKIDANGKKLKHEKNTESYKVVKHALKKKYFTRNSRRDVQSNTKFDSRTSTTSRVIKPQKRKRVDSTSKEENADCLNLNDLSKEHILQCISAIFHLTEEQLKSKNALFDGESQPVFMQVTCIRVPKTPRRCMRILLPYTIVSSSDEVALFVGDLQRGRRKDYEPTVEHYQDLLRKHDCTRINSIIPMNQVKTEYDQYELKRKLVDSYDYFLVDGKIAGHLSHLLGKEFYKKRKLPTPIRMQSKDLKHEVEYALRKSIMQMHSSGDTHIIQVGHTSMRKEEILENILVTCSYLSKNYPGGWANIRSVRIKTSISLGLPIYMTLKNKNLVDVPVVQPKRPKAYHDVSGELTTASGIAAVTVTPEGDITVVQRKRGYKNKIN